MSQKMIFKVIQGHCPLRRYERW